MLLRDSRRSLWVGKSTAAVVLLGRALFSQPLERADRTDRGAQKIALRTFEQRLGLSIVAMGSERAVEREAAVRSSWADPGRACARPA